MPRCPICHSTRITVRLAEVSSGSCSACGATWLVDGHRQLQVRSRGGAPAEEEFVTDWALPRAIRPGRAARSATVSRIDLRRPDPDAAVAS